MKRMLNPALKQSSTWLLLFFPELLEHLFLPKSVLLKREGKDLLESMENKLTLIGVQPLQQF